MTIDFTAEEVQVVAAVLRELDLCDDPALLSAECKFNVADAICMDAAIREAVAA